MASSHLCYVRGNGSTNDVGLPMDLKGVGRQTREICFSLVAHLARTNQMSQRIHAHGLPHLFLITGVPIFVKSKKVVRTAKTPLQLVRDCLHFCYYLFVDPRPGLPWWWWETVWHSKAIDSRSRVQARLAIPSVFYPRDLDWRSCRYSFRPREERLGNKWRRLLSDDLARPPLHSLIALGRFVCKD